MAFVFRSDKQYNIRSSTSDNIGPGSYNYYKKNVQQTAAMVPFGSTAARKPKQSKDNMPGPGDYQIQQLQANEKVIVSSTNEDIKIVEVPKNTSNFKSGSKRFGQNKQIKEEQPGPGMYDHKGMGENKLVPKLNGPKQNIIDHIMKINKYQSIPSIPGNTQAYGYTENEKNELELNKPKEKLFTGLKADVIGPGQYNLSTSIKVKNKGNKWHKQQTENKILKQHIINVGPGQYDIQGKNEPLYKAKQSSGFASKTMRGMQKKDPQGPRKIVSQGTTAIGDTDDEDEEFEYDETATPGPGFYQKDESFSSIQLKTKPEKFQFFGSSSDRFKLEKREFVVGPGDYNKPVEFGTGGTNKIQKKNPPFLSSNTRFETKAQEDQKPGPGQYAPKLTLEDKLADKMIKGYRGSFGTTNRRFKQGQIDEVPGPGTYLDPIQEDIDKEDQQLTAAFKTKVKRDLQSKKDQVPPIGAYKLDYYDIKKKCEKGIEEDEELVFKREGLGFGVAQPRFKEPKQDEPPIDEDDLPIKHDKNLSDLYNKQKKKNVKGVGFGYRNARFNYSSGHNPGPGNYHDNATNQWNKRTFNILFAEI